MRSIHSNTDLSKQAIIAQVIQQMPAEIDFTQKEMNELYYLSVECKNNSLSQEELITKITNLRGGSFVDVAAGLAIIAAIIILANNANGFQRNPHVNVPPHLQWLVIWKQLSTRSIWIWKGSWSTEHHGYRNDPKRWF